MDGNAQQHRVYTNDLCGEAFRFRKSQLVRKAKNFKVSTRGVLGQTQMSVSLIKMLIG